MLCIVTTHNRTSSRTRNARGGGILPACTISSRLLTRQSPNLDSRYRATTADMATSSAAVWHCPDWWATCTLLLHVYTVDNNKGFGD